MILTIIVLWAIASIAFVCFSVLSNNNRKHIEKHVKSSFRDRKSG